MYQFSLDAYIQLFILSIEKSPKSLKLNERIEKLNDFHTYAVYKYGCRVRKINPLFMIKSLFIRVFLNGINSSFHFISVRK
jgi:hypothetical protein